MPDALATALQTSIIIFTRNTDSPVMYITPEVIKTDYSIFVIFDPTGSGHYDAAVPYSDPAPSTQTISDVKPAMPVSPLHHHHHCYNTP